MENFFNLLRKWFLEDPNNRSDKLYQDINSEMRRLNLPDFPVVFPTINPAIILNMVHEIVEDLRKDQENILLRPDSFDQLAFNSQRSLEFTPETSGFKYKDRSSVFLNYSREVHYHFYHILRISFEGCCIFLEIYEDIYNENVTALFSLQDAIVYTSPNDKDRKIYGVFSKENIQSPKRLKPLLSQLILWILEKTNSDTYRTYDTNEQINNLCQICNRFGLSMSRKVTDDFPQ